MKRLSILCITMLSSICLWAAPYAASIEHVTVFTYGAELQQRVSLPLQAGDNTVVIENIAPNINEESLQIALGGGVIVRQYAFSLDYLNADKLKMNTAALQDSLKQAQDALADAERRIATLTQMQTLLQAGVNSSLTANTGVTTATIDKNLQYFRTNALELAKQLDATKTEKADLEQRIKVLKQQIKEVRGKNISKSGIVTLELNSPKKQTIAAGIKYYTESAAWIATYDLNISDLHSPIGLVMKAHVSQYTGLEWKNVKLTLSTGRPSSSNQAPELSTWWLQQQVTRARGVYAAKNAAMAVMADAAVAEEEVEVFSTGLAPTNTVQKYVEQNEQALSVEYAINLPYTIQGNGKEQIISLLERKLDDVAYNYFAAPAMDESAYLVAYINGWQQQQLPDGRANLTYNGTYYGETMLATNNDEARVRLTLGDDKQIKIKRELTAHNSKTSGSSKTVTYAYTTTIRNDKSEQVNITLKDRYPVSTAKEIQVSVGDKGTPTTEDRQSGILTYELTLAPGESKQLMLSYTVKYPKDWKINL